jgi:hypothetical protein
LCYPTSYFVEPFQAGFTIPFPALLPDNDQSTFSEDLDMFGDGGPDDLVTNLFSGNG